MIEKIVGPISRTRETLTKEIEEVSFERFNFKPGTNQWSIGQVSHHLYLSEEYFVDSIILAFESTDQKIEIKTVEHVLNRSIKVESPMFAKPPDDPLKVESVIEMLQESRRRLIAQINKIDDEKTLYIKGKEHPLFGLLSINQWIQLLNFHEIRHIEQIRELKESIL